ncbi:hypothetical protein C6497_06495 [Candidatus Poribacteria bacterium]|nr:MAG: hypothetical protein C6497_06495 [Candidatus Poribacteria bacterium]
MISKKYIQNKKTYQLSRKILTLLGLILLSISTLSCGNLFISETKYVAPELPESEVATIQIDTEGNWIQRTNIIVLRINGKVALRKEIGENKNIKIDDIPVVPGKHNMSILAITESYGENKPHDRQSMYKFTAELQPNRTYLLKGEYNYKSEEDYSFELINTANDKVVSKSKLFGKSVFKVQKEKDFSVESEF